MGEVYEFNTTTETPKKIDLDLAGMGEDVVIFDPNTKEIKHALKTGVANASGVVPVYK